MNPMLVLSRKTNESIVIDGNITISVLQVKGKIVRLGIEAPKEIPIRRKELRELTVARDLFVEFAEVA
jgi:carbon storage regulator